MAGAPPLLEIGGNPAPTGGEAEWVRGAGGGRLRAALFPPQGRVRGSVVVSPGRTEPIEKYFEVAGRLTGQGFAVLVHDWRGQGLSERIVSDGQLGHADGYADFLTDFTAVLDHFETRLPRPWLALGHSMGGCLTLLAVTEGEDRFAAALLSAPMLGLRTGQVPRLIARVLALIMRAIGRGAASIPAPGGSDPAAFEDNILTHDRERYARDLELTRTWPDLALGAPTWGWLDFAFSATDRLARNAGAAAICIPVVVLIAGEDILVDNQRAKATTARLPHGQALIIAGARHEILQETDEIQAPAWRAFAELAASVAP